MADEQPVTIYLSPEEELTSVRERLEKTQARRIDLVIPSQTQLRSHVGWRLIHARMRELGKDLLVISPDRQVRAVARAAGFRVAETQESPSNRSRSGGNTRPGSINTRGAARSRVSSSRGVPESRASQSGGGRRRPTPASNRPRPQLPPAEFDEEQTLSRPGPKSLERPQKEQPGAPALFFQEPEEKSGPIRDFHISTTPSVRPSVPGRDDEEDEGRNYYDDYSTAQRIRESASGRGAGGQPDRSSPSLNRGARESWNTATSRWGDPYAYLEDEQQNSPLPEQRGSVPANFQDIGSGAPDISDRSTEIMESGIEDLGDMGTIDLPEVLSIQKPESPVREPGGRPRPRPSGQMKPRSPRAPRPGAPDFDDDDELLALPDRPTRTGSQNLRPSRELPGSRSSQGLRPGAGPQAGVRPSQVLKQGSASQSAQRARPATGGQRAPSRQLLPTPAATTSRRPASPPRRARRSGRGLAIAFTILVLLLVVIGLFFYLVPTATVTVSLQSRTYSQTVHLNASADPQANVQNKVLAQQLGHDFSVSGQQKASGTTTVGDTRAEGQVIFTNNGTSDVTIPTGTVIATQSGVQFATNAETFVASGKSYPAVPITAQQTGAVGRVGAGTITVIPQSSIDSIAQYNHTTAQKIDLTVNNTAATKGGGTKNESAVTKQDLQALARTLHQSLQQQVNNWLAAQVRAGDVHGSPAPNVIGSTNPLPDEKLSNVPAVNQAVESGTFSGTLTLHVNVLVARAAALQAAAGKVLNAAAGQLRPASMLATQAPVVLTNEQATTSKDGNTLAITTKVTGTIIRQISTQDVAALLAGKGVGDVRGDLQNGIAQAGIQDVQVAVSPSFLGIMPLRADRIQVVLQPIQQSAPKNVPNG